MNRHKWDVIDDLYVCSAVMDGRINIPKEQKRLCRIIGVNKKQLLARANNYIHLLTGRASFWHTSVQERNVLKALQNHKVLIK